MQNRSRETSHEMFFSILRSGPNLRQHVKIIMTKGPSLEGPMFSTCLPGFVFAKQLVKQVLPERTARFHAPRLSVDLWLETRSFVEQLDSLLDMVGGDLRSCEDWEALA